MAAVAEGESAVGVDDGTVAAGAVAPLGGSLKLKKEKIQIAKVRQFKQKLFSTMSKFHFFSLFSAFSKRPLSLSLRRLRKGGEGNTSLLTLKAEKKPSFGLFMGTH